MARRHRRCRTAAWYLCGVKLTCHLVLALAFAACGGSARPPAPAPAPTTPVAAPPTEATGGAAAAPAGDGPTADESMAWVLAALQASKPPTAAEIDARFAPAFLAEVPTAKIIEIFGMLASQLPPLKVVEQKSQPPQSTITLLDTKSGGIRVILAMTKTTPRQITTLLIQPATAETPPRTYGDAVAQLTRAGARSQLFVAELDRGRCIPRQNHNTTTSLAVGSTAKLWVLLALDEKLKRSKGLGWDTPLAIRDAGKSLPSGEMQDLAAGTERPLREYAEKMISISDNTATDHLIDYVGREAVERGLKLAKHGKPAANTPFLGTRELFVLKLATSAEELAAYKKAKPAGKRKLLAQLRGRPLDLATAVKEWTAPRHLDLEWFADGRDLCQVMAALAVRGKLDPGSELLKILGKNPGVPFDEKQWSYVGFKGGSEPGVVNLTWLARRADGKWFVVVAAVNDDSKIVDEGLVANAGAGTLQILGAEAAPAPAPKAAPAPAPAPKP